MAKRESMEQIAKSLEPSLRKAFLDAVQDIKTSSIIRTLELALAEGHVARVLEILNLDPAFLGPLQSAVQAAYNAAGTRAVAALGTLPPSPGGGRVVARFNGANPRAAAWVSEHGTELIQEMLEDQRIGIREFLTNAYSEGRHPREIALDMVGRVSKDTGRRTGGILMLRSDQMQAAQRMRSELSGVPSSAKYRRRALRDKRFDKAVAAAEKAGKALPKEMIDKIVGKYEDRMLKHRAETIARTEAIGATHKAQSEGMQQQIDSGKIDQRFVTKTWSATGGPKTRDHHMALNNVSKPWHEPFVSPLTGKEMMHPGDTSRGAKGADTINCRCHMYIRVDRYAALREYERLNPVT